LGGRRRTTSSTRVPKPRRRQLLDQIGVRHELLLPRADEDAEALEANGMANCRSTTSSASRARSCTPRGRLTASGLLPRPSCVRTRRGARPAHPRQAVDAADAVATLSLLSGRRTA